MYEKKKRLLGPIAMTSGVMAMIAIFYPASLLAQHRGGGGGAMGAGMGEGGARNSIPIICLHDCSVLREGLSSEDALRNFRRSIALQANEEQQAAFAKLAQYTQTASDQFVDFQASLKKSAASLPLADRMTGLEQAIESARAASANFLTSLSAVQKSGLQQLTTRLARADSELDKQVIEFNQLVQAPSTTKEQIVANAVNVGEKISHFQSEQLGLSREMGILLSADSHEFAFSLPAIRGANLLAPMPWSGVIARTSAENGHNTFILKLTADLSDLQQNLTEVVRPRLDRFPRCGERIETRRAVLSPMIPAGLAVVDFHYERWICPSGPNAPFEAIEADATVEMKMTPSLDPNGGLQIASEFTRIGAEGAVRDLIRSGELGATLRDAIAAAVRSSLPRAADLKAELPPVARNLATLQKAEFDEGGPDQLNLVMEGQVELSDNQVQQFASQLKLPESAKQNASRQVPN